MRIYLPDADTGYYRGPRFDWAGMIHTVEHEGRTYFGEWKVVDEPEATDNVVGTAGEFGMKSPLAYDAAAVGENFIKIGVGLLGRTDGEPYNFAKNYPIAEPLPWHVTRGERWIQIEQTLADHCGFGYRYSKRIELADKEAALIVAYRLENTGTRAISTDYYCHNFVVFDGQPLRPGIKVNFAFMPTEDRELKGVAKVSSHGVELLAPLPVKASLWHRFTDVPRNPSSNFFEFINPATHQILRIRGDTTPSEIVFYGIGKAVCGEAFIPIQLAPSEVKAWSDRYEFSMAPTP